MFTTQIRPNLRKISMQYKATQNKTKYQSTRPPHINTGTILVKRSFHSGSSPDPNKQYVAFTIVILGLNYIIYNL